MLVACELEQPLSARSLLLGMCAHAAAQGTTDLFPPGYNGEAMQPPMGWRSWNAFGPRITNETFVEAILALTSPVWSVDGRNVSLADVRSASLSFTPLPTPLSLSLFHAPTS